MTTTAPKTGTLNLIPLPDQLGIGGLWYLGQQNPAALGTVLLELRAAIAAGAGDAALQRINEVIAPAQAVDASINAFSASMVDCHEAQRAYGQVAVNAADISQITDLNRLAAAEEGLALLAAAYDGARMRVAALREQMETLRHKG